MATGEKVGIIGSGNVGGALARGLQRAGRDVRTAGKDPDEVRDTAAWADVLILAVPFGALDDVASKIRASVGRNTVVIDVTNALTSEMKLALGFSSSGAEELQKKLPGARVVKAFNTQFAQHMDSGRLGDRTLTVFAAGDDADAKRVVMELAKAIGFDAVDAGPLLNARLLEPLGVLNIQLGYGLGLGTQIGLQLVRR